MGEVLSQAGRWRARELAVESAVPLWAAGAAIAALYQISAEASSAAPLSLLELTVLLCATAALVAWAAARQLWLSGDRRARRALVVGIGAALAAVQSTGSAAGSAFEEQCAKELAGQVLQLTPRGWLNTMVCQSGGVAGNPALQGVLYRARWDGEVPVVLWPLLVLVSGTVGVGLRGRRLRPTSVPVRLAALLERRPAVGLAGALGDPLPKDGRVVACANRTWWGASCGQIYSADRVWSPGEWCRRCRLPFHADRNTVQLDVLLPVSADLPTLNAMERVDTQSWAPGTPLRALGSSVSGAPRWVRVGGMNIPSILPVSMVISLAHDLLPLWAAGATPEAASAIALAQARASRLVAWLWAGEVLGRLHLATPSRSLMIVSGGARLRDLISGGTGRLALQLDIGVLPIEVRAGYLHRPRPESRAELGEPWASLGYVANNLKYTTWIATRPDQETTPSGLWVPRIEGDALIRWLSRERPTRVNELPEGATRAVAYVPWKNPLKVKPVVGLLDVDAAALGAISELAPYQIKTLAGPSDNGIAEVDLVLVRASPDDPPSVARLAQLRARPEQPALVALTTADGWPPEEATRQGLKGWARLPLEHGDAEELAFLALDAARARLARPPLPGSIEENAPLDFVLAPLVGQLRTAGGPAEPTLAVQPGQNSGEPEDQEPVRGDDLPLGAALDEWDWFDLPMIGRLRREVIVMRKAPSATGGDR